jgi:hypothetical protein
VKLPFADQAVVSDAKIREYLLNEAHPTGRDKAAFFATLGFRRDQTAVFRRALLQLASGIEVEEVASGYGRKFVGTGEVRGLLGKRADILTVWMLRDGQPPPMLVTAYPGEEERVR